MSLFRRLIRLHSAPRPTENFFTEIITHTFNVNRDLPIVWLASIGAISSDNVKTYEILHISSQKNYTKLADHVTDSRPDMIIELVNQSEKILVFIESKIASTQNPSQLIRYAEILAEKSSFTKKVLIYVTRDFENISDFWESFQDSNALNKIVFIQTRWHRFYQIIDKHQDSELIQEVKTFMREEKMNQDNQFSATDILAMSNFRHTFSIIENTLSGKVDDRLKTAFPGVRMSSILDMYKHLRLWPRLARHVHFKEKDFKLMIGYFDLHPESELLYPDVKICLQVHTASESGQKAFSILEEIVGDIKTPWQSEWSAGKGEWPYIAIRKSLQDFLGEKDQVKEIQQFFLSGIEQVLELKKAHPELPWGF